MDLAVSDANILIHFAKLNQLELLGEIFSEILITEVIYNESVTQGKFSNKKDSFVLEDFIHYCLTNEIKVRKVIKSEGIEVIGTLGIILKAYTIKKINKTKCLDLLKYILSNLQDFRIHPKLVEKIIDEVNKKNVSTI